MSRVNNKKSSVLASAALASAALVFGFAGPAAAKGSIGEVTLASPDQALAYCQSGSMPADDIAYISGGPGLVQYGPSQNCAQSVPTKGKITKAIQVVGSTVSECKLANAKKSVAYCESGAMGEWDIDYISGKVGYTLSGPGYGCETGFSSSSIGNAICK